MSTWYQYVFYSHFRTQLSDHFGMRCAPKMTFDFVKKEEIRDASTMVPPRELIHSFLTLCTQVFEPHGEHFEIYQNEIKYMHCYSATLQ